MSVGSNKDGVRKGFVDKSPTETQYRTLVDNDETKPVPTINAPANRSSFGDDLCESSEPISQISATYGLQDGIETFNATGGTVDETDNNFECSTGVSIGGYGVIRTRRSTVYREGQGLMARYTAEFDENAVANSLQFAGLFNLTDTLAFGYDGATFSIIYQSYGRPEIRDLTITASGNGNLTLTLDGTAYVIPITSGTVEHNAYEIEAWMQANQSVWNVQQVDDTVVFQARDTSARNGTYSIAGTTLAGTFSQINAGAAKTDAHIPQTSWDNNPAWFDPHVFNVYMQKVSYLGYGPIKFFIMNTSTGLFELVHTLKPLGSATKPSVSKRALKVGWTSASLGSTTDLTVRGGSAATFIEGKSSLFSSGRTVPNTNSSVGFTFAAILTIRASDVYNGKVNLGRLVPVSVSVATDSTKPVEYILVKNPTLGETDYTTYGTDSIAQYDFNAHTYASIEGIFSSVLSAGGSQVISLVDLDIELTLNEHITVFARKTSGTNPSVTASITWREDV